MGSPHATVCVKVMNGSRDNVCKGSTALVVVAAGFFLHPEAGAVW